MKAIRKALFPVAGLGSRFLPVTKALPKELLPIVDKPLIQYAAEEAINAGLDTLIFVTGRNKRAIEDHFDANKELENHLILKPFLRRRSISYSSYSSRMCRGSYSTRERVVCLKATTRTSRIGTQTGLVRYLHII